MNQVYRPPDAALLNAAQAFLGKARPPSGVRIAKVRSIIIPFDGGGAPIPTDYMIRIPVFWDVEIIGWSMVANAAGTLVVTINRATYDSYPGITTNICPTNPPSLGGAIKNKNPFGVPFTGWTTVLRDGDWLLCGVSGTPTVNSATLGLRTKEL